MVNLDMRGMPDHHPQRDDQVAAWIKDRRDAHKNNDLWAALDVLLDEYRLAADTGWSLEEVVNGERERPQQGERKPKRSK
jgi:hypothetical protein